MFWINSGFFKFLCRRKSWRVSRITKIINASFHEEFRSFRWEKNKHDSSSSFSNESISCNFSQMIKQLTVFVTHVYYRLHVTIDLSVVTHDAMFAPMCLSTFHAAIVCETWWTRLKIQRDDSQQFLLFLARRIFASKNFSFHQARGLRWQSPWRFLWWCFSMTPSRKSCSFCWRRQHLSFLIIVHIQRKCAHIWGEIVLKVAVCSRIIWRLIVSVHCTVDFCLFSFFLFDFRWWDRHHVSVLGRATAVRSAPALPDAHIHHLRESRERIEFCFLYRRLTNCVTFETKQHCWIYWSLWSSCLRTMQFSQPLAGLTALCI